MLIQAINKPFYNEFVREFLSDPITYQGFDKELVNALEAVAGIRICVDDPKVTDDFYIYVSCGDVTMVAFDNYEDALMYAVKLLSFDRVIA